MSNWHIVKQIDRRSKFGRVVEEEVEIKHIRFFPVLDRRKSLTGFGRLKDKTLSVQYAHNLSPQDKWKVTYTRHGFNITCPDRLEFANRLPNDKTKVRVPGTCFSGKATSGSMSLLRFMREIVQQTGSETGEYIVQLFLDKLAESQAKAA